MAETAVMVTKRAAVSGMAINRVAVSAVAMAMVTAVKVVAQ